MDDDNQVEDQVLENSFLEMSDDEIMNMSGPPAIAAPVVAEQAPVVDEAVSEEAPETQDVEETKEGAAAEATEEDAGADGGTPASKAAPEVADASSTVDDPAKKVETKDEAPAIDYKAEYERLTAPFKANGREVQVGSVDDAINLMQMGANYNKKMAALKPNLKLMKLLENNGLLSEEKISFMIDLGKKDPGAINKLVKESGIDPMDLDAEKASAYKQTAYAVDEREIELDTVLDDIKDSTTYTRTLDVVSNKWDVASKQAISQAPQLLKVIDDHMASGIYDLISTEIERERVFGRLKGLSDIEAYRQVGDAIQARGGFNHLFTKNTVQPNQPATPVIVQPKPKVDEAELNNRRRAASSTKPAAPTTTPKEYNPLSMSDEEFAKLAEPKFR